MENYIVSARKYRPRDFNTVVGQKSLTLTLKNSIKTKQLAHAYLFCGPRGVGKTTCARIFAKTINCSNPTSDFEACNECESCKSFIENRSYNIRELDAASNNSVEDIRSLIEQVRVPPQIGTHSVYIIDEVHMLSSQAFNAFLKTLEEPPEYAIFVLATTEKHKILPTILSRCQIFDFNRITVNDIAEHLSYVAEKEGIEAEKDALNIIAQKADGAMRDALSFFDQIASFSDRKISYKAALDNLNVLDYDYYFKITDNILQNNISEILLIFNDVLEKGFDGHHFISGLSAHFRDLMVCKDASTVELLEVSDNIKRKYLEQSAKTSVSFLLKALDIGNTADIAYNGSKNKRLQVELALMKMSALNAVQEKKQDNRAIKTESSSKATSVSEPASDYKKEAVAEQKPVEQKKNDAPEEKKVETTSSASSEQGMKTIKRKSGISINLKNVADKSKEAETKKNAEPEVADADVEKYDLDIAWTMLVEMFSGKTRIYRALKNEKLKMIAENHFELSVINNSLEQTLLSVKARMVSFLQKKTGNTELQLSFKVKENSSDTENKLIYTDKDKYKYLVKKNPNLEKLRSDLDLDFL